MRDRLVDLIIRVVIILMFVGGFQIMKENIGFESVVLFAFALTLVELYTKSEER